MNLKAIFLSGSLLAISPLHGSAVYPFNNQPLTVNNCALKFTGNPLDIALRHDGYFVVSQGKKNKELLFTRFGALYLDQDHYIRTSEGGYLLGINKKSSPNLNKLKISMMHMPPKASTQVKTRVNLSIQNNQFGVGYTIYDAISNRHYLKTVYTRNEPNIWTVQILIDGIKLNKGRIVFKPNGRLEKQEGLSHIQWPANYGLDEIKMDLTGSTQFATPSSVEFAETDGYPVGTLDYLYIGFHGDFLLRYSNFQTRELKHRVAVAKFTDSASLERVAEHLYKPTEKSGFARLHWKNSEYAIDVGYIEPDSCTS